MNKTLIWVNSSDIIVSVGINYLKSTHDISLYTEELLPLSFPSFIPPEKNSDLVWLVILEWKKGARIV